MNRKKSDKADLEGKRSLFLPAGLLASILICIALISIKTYEGSGMDLGTVDFDLEEEIAPITEREQKPPPPPPPPPDVIQVVEDEVELEEELEIEETETDEEEVIEIIEEEEESDEVFNFAVVEDKPVFPGCEGLKGQANKECFDLKIRQHILSTFKYPPMAMDLGVTGTVYVQFTITKNGSIEDVKIVRSVSEDLDNEAMRNVKLLPKMTPAKQRGKAVPVAFTVPVKFAIGR